MKDDAQLTYFELVEERRILNQWLTLKMLQFNDVGTFHLVDPDEYWEKLQERIAVDRMIEELKDSVCN